MTHPEKYITAADREEGGLSESLVRFRFVCWICMKIRGNSYCNYQRVWRMSEINGSFSIALIHKLRRCTALNKSSFACRLHCDNRVKRLGTTMGSWIGARTRGTHGWRKKNPRETITEPSYELTKQRQNMTESYTKGNSNDGKSFIHFRHYFRNTEKVRTCISSYSAKRCFENVSACGFTLWFRAGDEYSRAIAKSMSCNEGGLRTQEEKRTGKSKTNCRLCKSVGSDISLLLIWGKNREILR